MTRTGKVARLPHHIREPLNRRLQDAEEGKLLVSLLNSPEKVKSLISLPRRVSILAIRFFRVAAGFIESGMG